MMMTLISGTANSKAQIWHLFTHGEYFQPQRALIKQWIQTGYLQKKKTTEEDQLSLSRPKLDPVTPSSIWHQAPPCWINGATSSGWSWRWWATTRLAAVDVVPPVNDQVLLVPENTWRRFPARGHAHYSQWVALFERTHRLKIIIID